MSAENKLLDKVSEVCGLNDSQIGAKIGRTRGLVHLWRKGKSHMADEDIAKLCALASLDGGTWALQIHADRAASRTEKAMWNSLLDRLSAAAAVVALIVLLPLQAKAENVDGSKTYAAESRIDCILCGEAPSRKVSATGTASPNTPEQPASNTNNPTLRFSSPQIKLACSATRTAIDATHNVYSQPYPATWNLEEISWTRTYIEYRAPTGDPQPQRPGQLNI